MFDKIVVSTDSNGKLSIRVLNIDGGAIASSNYKVSTKAISARKGCGTYKVTVKLNAKCGGKTITQTVTVVPKTSDIYISIAYYGWERYGKKNCNTDCNVSLHYSSSALKTCDGIEYIIGKDKNYKSVYASATTELGKDGFSKAFKAKFNATCYIKYRVYTIVGGKKLYSEWKYDSEKLIP